MEKRNNVLVWICLTLLAHFPRLIVSIGVGNDVGYPTTGPRSREIQYSFFNFPSKPRSSTSSPTLPPDCIQCQREVGASCINAVCCSNLACIGGLCVTPGCGVLGATCAFGANQCCEGFNLDCLFNTLGFTCQQCIPQSQACNPAIQPGFVGSCCFGLRCLNSVCSAAIG